MQFKEFLAEAIPVFKKVGAAKGVVGRSIRPEDVAAAKARKRERDAEYARVRAEKNGG